MVGAWGGCGAMDDLDDDDMDDEEDVDEVASGAGRGELCCIHSWGRWVHCGISWTFLFLVIGGRDYRTP